MTTKTGVSYMKILGDIAHGHAKCSPYSIVVVSNLFIVKVGDDVVGMVANSF